MRRTESTTRRVAVYTDGACLDNPGMGGWAWVLPDGPYESGFDSRTTNNRMELMAVIRALEALAGFGNIEVVTDSRYVSSCFEERWWEGWERRGWKTASRKPVKNQDLWRPLVGRVLDGGVTFRWVKGHRGNFWNEFADSQANEAARMQTSNRSKIMDSPGWEERYLASRDAKEKQGTPTDELGGDPFEGSTQLF